MSNSVNLIVTSSYFLSRELCLYLYPGLISINARISDFILLASQQVRLIFFPKIPLAEVTIGFFFKRRRNFYIAVVVRINICADPLCCLSQGVMSRGLGNAFAMSCFIWVNLSSCKLNLYNDNSSRCYPERDVVVLFWAVSIFSLCYRREPLFLHFLLLKVTEKTYHNNH